MNTVSQKIILVKRPIGLPELDSFQLITSEIPPVQEGGVLLKVLYFSLDPYMRGRMNEGKSYAEHVELGEVMPASSICRVEQSKNSNFVQGDIVLAYTGWQTYIVLYPDVTQGDNLKRATTSLKKIPPKIKSTYFLGALGMPGITAFHGLVKIGMPKEGETVVVSSATGAVGSIVGQLAKAHGCRVIGIAGGAQKCRFAIEKLHFDDCIDHHQDNFEQLLKQACPQGIDIYFENVAGKVLFAVLPLLNNFARIPVCGAIAWYNNIGLPQGPDLSPLIIMAILIKRIKMQGFIVSDHMSEYDEFLQLIIPMIHEGKIIIKEDIVKGIENSPKAFMGLLEGKNFGKLIIEI